MSNLTSKPMVNDKIMEKESKRKASAVVGRATLRKQRGTVERATAWIVLFMSFLGTIVAFHGGWDVLIDSVVNRQPNIAAWLFGFGLQLFLTFLQWYYYDNRIVAWSARGFDTWFTAVGYGPLFLAPLMAFLVARGIESPLYFTWGMIGIASLLAAWYPESRLVD
jgi:hypothetical protein